MNILLISRCPPYPTNLGDRLIVWHVARELHKRGITLDLLAFTQQMSDHQEQAEYEAFCRDIVLIPESPRPGLSYLRRTMFESRRFPADSAQCWSPAMWQAIESQLEQRDYDAVHLFGGIHVYEFYHLVRHLPNLIVPYESFTLLLMRDLLQNGGIRRRLMYHLARQFEAFMYRPYDRVVVLAQPDRAMLQTLNPGLPVETIANGIDLDYFVPQPQPRDPATLLFLGNYAYGPNADAALVLIETILPQVRAQIPDVRLVLAGHSPTAAMQAHASEHVIVTGSVPDVRPYLASASLFVCPLRYGAGMKNKVLEAMAMRLPVIATQVSVDGIAVEDDVHVCIAAPDTMPDDIVALLRDEARREAMGSAGRALIESQYGWDITADAYVQLYETLQAEAGDSAESDDSGMPA